MTLTSLTNGRAEDEKSRLQALKAENKNLIFQFQKNAKDKAALARAEATLNGEWISTPETDEALRRAAYCLQRLWDAGPVILLLELYG